MAAQPDDRRQRRRIQGQGMIPSRQVHGASLSALSVVFTLLLGACAESKSTIESAPPPDVIDNPDPPRVADDGPLWHFNRLAHDLPVATSARWGMLPKLTNGNTLAVGIIRGNGANAIQVLCDENHDALSILVWPRAPMWEAQDARRLTLGFDDGLLTVDWFSTPVGFGLRHINTGFDLVMRRLSERRSVTLMVREPSGETEQDVLSLDGAEQAIALAQKDCS